MVTAGEEWAPDDERRDDTLKKAGGQGETEVEKMCAASRVIIAAQPAPPP
jgi:hypothetical protein